MSAVALAWPDTRSRAVPAPESRCAQCAGRQQSICADLPPDVLGEIARIGRVRRLRRGEVLSWEGDETYDVGNVRDGALKLTASLRDGREQILGVAWPGSFVGELFADQWTHRATALASTTVCVYRRADLNALAVCYPEIATSLLRRFSNDLDTARRSILSLGRKTAEERVASMLVDMRRSTPCDMTGATPMSLNRQQMADLLGLTIETVSRKIRRFERAGIIQLIGTRLFRVLDDVGLARLAG
jgi:CRP/FNR family transcriptional regulator